LPVLAFTAACGSPTIDGPIDYRTSGGFTGNGEGTSIHIELDGRMTKTTGTDVEERTLDPATLDDLHAAVYGALPLDRSFEACCDNIVDEIDARLDGDVDHLAVNRDATDIPDDVAALVAFVRSL